MIKWLLENINGKHQRKRLELQNDDEYFEFMIQDFNNRLKLSVTFGFILGTICGVVFLNI